MTQDKQTEYWNVVDEIHKKMEKSVLKDSEQGYTCESCGWEGMYARLSDDLEEVVVCPECESSELKLNETDLEFLQEHGYSYDELPD